MIFHKSILTFLLAFVMLIGKAQNLVAYRDDNAKKFGFKNASGKIVIKPIYTSANDFNDGVGAVTLTGKWNENTLSYVGGWGFIDKTAKVIIPLKYDAVNSFKDGVAGVKLNGKWGAIDKTGKEVVPFNFDGISDFSEGLAAIKIGKKWGFVDKTGELVIPATFDEPTAEDYILNGGAYLYTFYDHQARVISGGKIKYLESYGQVTPIPNFKMAIFSLLAEAKTNFKTSFGKLIKQEDGYDFYQAKTRLQLNLKLPTNAIIEKDDLYTYWATFEADKFTADELNTINAKILEVGDTYVDRNLGQCVKEISKNKNGEVVTEFVDKMTRNVILRIIKAPQKITLSVMTNPSMYIG